MLNYFTDFELNACYVVCEIYIINNVSRMPAKICVYFQLQLHIPVIMRFHTIY